MLGRISLMRIRNTKFEKIHTNSYAPKNDFLSYYLCLLSETLISIFKNMNLDTPGNFCRLLCEFPMIFKNFVKLLIPSRF